MRLSRHDNASQSHDADKKAMLEPLPVHGGSNGPGEPKMGANSNAKPLPPPYYSPGPDDRFFTPMGRPGTDMH